MMLFMLPYILNNLIPYKPFPLPSNFFLRLSAALLTKNFFLLSRAFFKDYEKIGFARFYQKLELPHFFLMLLRKRKLKVFVKKSGLS